MSNNSEAMNDPTINNESDPAKEKLRAEFDALHAELEVANYGVGKNGRARRKISRLESKVRTIKRKSLEIEDAKVAAVRSSQTKRMRGSKAALEDEVINGSLIFETSATKSNKESEEDYESEYIPSESDGDDENSEDDEDHGRYNLYAEELNIDVEDDDDQDDDNADETIEEQEQQSLSEVSQNAKPSKQKTTVDKFSGNKIAKTMYKLKNFKSYKLAQRHGEALGAHARGLNALAVDKLKEVAAAAPVAPQIYSSLGLVYESMLREEMQKAKGKENLVTGIECTNDKNQSIASNADTLESVCERIKLAKKTFGSYHVAALLCKMDFSLWVSDILTDIFFLSGEFSTGSDCKNMYKMSPSAKIRAGDAALAIANLHSYCLSLSPTLCDVESSTINTQSNGSSATEEFVRFHKVQRTKWLEEAKEDYQSADNLCPPGISVPSKLAHTHMELGNLSEALTILTDVKNKHQKEIECSLPDKHRSRTELEKSFSTWMLYADLMLLIGHECEQWNRGIYTNDNYMFKRWLRKYSKSFNWQERRFQALCMALEAAAGSNACRELIIWVNERVRITRSEKKILSEDEAKWQIGDDYESDRNVEQEQTKSNTMKDLSSGESDVNAIEQNDAHGSSSLSQDIIHSLSALRNKFNEDRCSLLSSNDSELLQFDTVTKGMALIPGSQVANKREAERNSLIANHKQVLMDLAVKYQLNKTSMMMHMNKDLNGTPQPKKKDLALSASCAVVCDIAFQLVKQCLAMDLYRGAIITCEAVSLYLKERAMRYQDQEKRWKRYAERQDFDGKPVLQLEKEAYDTMMQDDNEEEEDSIVLSDDEDFDSPDGEKFIQLMMNGVLPPELQVLYGISLVAEGTSPFLAIKMLRAIELLDETECVDVELISKCDQSESISIRVFRKSMVEPMNKLETFAFFSDVLRKSKKEEEWAERLLPIFDQYIHELDRSNGFSLLRDAVIPQTIVASIKVRNCTKLLFSTYRMRISVANSILTSSNSLQLEKAYELSMAVIDDNHRYLDSFWRTKSGNPVSESVEMLKIVSSAFTIIIAILDKSDCIKIKSLHDVVNKLKIFVAIICRIEFNDLYLSKSTLNLDTLRYFPITSNWLSDEQSTMSRCAYNLSVAGAVSSFSGWENDEFTLNLLKRHWKDTFFGVSLKGKHVAGYLSENNEKRLSSLWQLIEVLIPTLNPLDFENAVSHVKHDDWYKKAMKHLKSFENEPISCHGEDSALTILLIFAEATLMLAKEQDDKRKKESLVKHALSILLPTSQFCLDQSLWDSEIGTKGAGDNSDWQIFSTDDSEVMLKIKTNKPAKKTQPTKIQQKNRQHNSKVNRPNQRSTSPFSKLIKISADMMLKEWTGKSTFEGGNDEQEIDDDTPNQLNKWSNNVSGKSLLAMKKLDYSIKKLRQCVTINALQKASLQVALVLLEVAGTKECQNPFVCLSQAAIFAAQGPKGGNNDEDFKKPLPREVDCTAEEALQILGRADCLRALHFMNEAVFLCSYVARVCCLHRDRQEPDHPWTPRWRIIGIMTYTVSVSIDSSICSIMHGEEMNLTLDSWDKSVRAEIGRGRSDAIALQKSFGRQNSYFERKFSSLKLRSTPKENKKEDYEDSCNDHGDEEYDDYDDSDQSREEDLDDINFSDREPSPDEKHVYDSDDDMNGGQPMVSVPPLPPILDASTQSTSDFANIPTVEI